MFLLTANGVEHFQNGLEYRQYTYRSAIYHLQGNMSFTSAKVMSDGGVTIELFNEGRSRYRRFVVKNKPFRIPRQGKWIDIQYELTGTGVVEAVEIGGSHFELAST